MFKFLIWGLLALKFGGYLHSPLLLMFLFWVACSPFWCLHSQSWFTIICILLLPACAFSTHKCWNSMTCFFYYWWEKSFILCQRALKLLSQSQWMKVCFQGLIPVSCVTGVKYIWGYKKRKIWNKKRNRKLSHCQCFWKSHFCIY